MKDYTYVDEKGTSTPILNLPLHIIHECLFNEKLEVYTGGITKEQIMDRLRIELIIRELKL